MHNQFSRKEVGDDSSDIAESPNLELVSGRIPILSLVFWGLLTAYAIGIWQSVFFSDFTLDRLVLENSLSLDLRHRMMESILWATCFVGVCFVVVPLLRRRGNPLELHFGILLLQGIVLGCFASGCFSRSLWFRAPFFSYAWLIVSAAGVGIFWIRAQSIVRFLGWSNSIPTLRPRTAFTLMAITAIAGTMYFGYFTSVHHLKFRTHAFDMGFIQNALLNSLRGNFGSSSYLGGDSFLSVHFALVHLLALPFFFFVPRAETLLVLQSFILMASAAPLFLLSQRLLKNSGSALLVCILYLLHPAHHTALFHDVNELAALSFFFFTLLYVIENRRLIPVLIATTFTLCVKDDMAYMLLPVAAFAWMRTHEIKYFLIIAITAILWRAGASMAMVGLGGAPDRYSGYFATSMAPGSSGVWAILATLLLNPIFLVASSLTAAKIMYFLTIFTPFTFLPFLRPRTLLLCAYGLVVFATASHPPIFSIGFQYVWYLLPTAMAASLYALNALDTPALDSNTSRPRPHALAGPILAAMAFATVATSWRYGAVFNKANFLDGSFDFSISSTDRARRIALGEISAVIPTSASVSADESIGPQLYRLLDVSTFRYFNRPTDYLLLWKEGAAFSPKLQELMRTGQYRMVKTDDYFQLYVRTGVKDLHIP